jgi:hypothetical protein
VFDKAALWRGEATGNWRKLGNEETHNLHKGKESEVGGSCSIYGRGDKPIQNFSRKA